MTEPSDGASSSCCSGSSCCGPTASDLSRRSFLAATAAVGASSLVAGPFSSRDLLDPDHFVPADKKLAAAWVRALFERGEATWYSKEDLRTIGFPIGGICAGQLYLTGDGRLVNWDVFNANTNSGYGALNYVDGRAPTARVERGRQMAEAAPVDQGFAVRVRSGSKTWVRTIDARGFERVRFNGEYPIANVEFSDDTVPIDVRLEAFSPFVPLDAHDSSLPCTVMRYTLRNRSTARVEVAIAGWLENVVCRASAADAFTGRVLRTNRTTVDGELAAVRSSARLEEPEPDAPSGPPIVLSDFEGSDYGKWTVEGEAFGASPAQGTLPRQQKVSGFGGKGLVNTFLDGDTPQGRLVSPSFRIERPFLSFLIGGGAAAGATCINLLVDGKVVRTATGREEELLRPHDWDVRELAGKTARLEIVDHASGPWGHVNVDQIELRDTPMRAATGELVAQPDWGTLCLAIAGEGAASSALPAGVAGEVLFAADGLLAQAGDAAAVDVDTTHPLRGAVGRELVLEPEQSAEVVFVVAWHFPNLWYGERRVGNLYAKRFADAFGVAQHVVRDLDRLSADTRAWHDTFYDSTLPHWLLDRVHSTVANLATSTCQWWGDGRFWAWEGAGCCHGTCGHVWNYAQGLARLFPTLERSAREMQDFAPGIGFDAATGSIGFRGEGWKLWAGDSQAGYVLKAWREHQCSADSAFLGRIWPRVKQATEFLIARDTEDGESADGLLEGRQHNTYDIDFYGGNTMVGSLYLAALRAAEEMAKEVGDPGFAARCRGLFESGSRATVEQLFDGEYFVQKVDLTKHPDWQYQDGCLADQLFGQAWAHQVGLGYVYPRDTVQKAVASIWKYDWAPDVGPQNSKHAPERWFARPGEAGLFTCTWPKSKHMGARSVRYRDEIWTGIEYQVAAHMAFEGMVTEALAICRGVHERYHPRKHNPWNEIECGDHYARSLASWGMLIALSGFEYHGPAGRIAFLPGLGPEAFRCAFTAAEGWGSYAQHRTDGEQIATIELRWGRLRLAECTLGIPEGRKLERVFVSIDDREVPADASQDGVRIVIALRSQAELQKGSTAKLRITYA